jgi:serine/threonine protein kinase/WD40 repeat protein
MDEKSIFIEALQRDNPDERAAYLDAACADQPELRQRIEALLRRHDDAGSFLEKPPVEYLTPETVLDPDSHRPDIYGMAQPAAGQAPGEEPDLGFLDPCDKPDTLGQFGSYEILEVLGAGGMGVVLKARDPKLNRILAIKVLAPQFAANAMGRKRFLREGRAAAAIIHDHIVSIHGINESEHLPFLMMEYVDGLSLQQRIDRDGPLELKEILRIGKQAALGVAAAHDQGLIHRDIKPSNILLENSVERVRITDFGLARAVDDVSITRTGVISGTPQYMSPEQAQNGPIDHRSDLFSLGSVLYAMCTGRSPFRGDSMVTVIRRVCDDEPRPIRDVNPDIPDWLVDIIDRLLAKDPDERFQTASEVAKLLGQHLAHLQHPSVNPMPPDPQRRSGRSGKASGGRPWGMVTAVLLLLLGGLSLTEATGVTELADTVIEVFTPRGTLVIEVDDPGMSVTVDQDGEELTVSDETHHVLTLRPGEVEVRAEKDGKEIHRQLATITRGGRRVVSIAISEPPPPPPAEDPSPEPETPAPPPTRSRLLANIQFANRKMGFDVSPDGQRILSSTPWGKVALWDTTSGLELMSLEGHVGLVESVVYAPNRRFFASGGEDGTVTVWDANTGQKRLTLKGHHAHVRCLCFSPNSQWLATSGRDDQTIKLWDATTGRLHHTLKHPNYVPDLAFDAEGERIVAGGRIHPLNPRSGADTPFPCVVKVWDVGTGREVHELDFGSGGTNVTRFSPDGKLIATCGVAQVRVWDSETGHLLFVAKHRIHYGADVFSVSFSPDSRRLATAGANNEVVIWDTANGKELMALPHPQRLNHATYSPDGNWLAACTRDGILKLWHANSGQCHLTLQEHIGDFRARFTPDGRRLISAGKDGAIKVWDVSDITGNKQSIKVRLEPMDAMAVEEGEAEPVVASSPGENRLDHGTPDRTAPSTGWKLLFDGKDTSEWQELGGFRVVEGELRGPRGELAKSRDEYGDFELEFEWRISSHGNGGVYYRERETGLSLAEWRGTEYQLLDNQGHPNGRNPRTTAGSLYGHVAPAVDATKPLGEFNTSRILARGSKVEHWMNGKKLLSYNLDQ